MFSQHHFSPAVSRCFQSNVFNKSSKNIPLHSTCRICCSKQGFLPWKVITCQWCVHNSFPTKVTGHKVISVLIFLILLSPSEAIDFTTQGCTFTCSCLVPINNLKFHHHFSFFFPIYLQVWTFLPCDLFNLFSAPVKAISLSSAGHTWWILSHRDFTDILCTLSQRPHSPRLCESVCVCCCLHASGSVQHNRESMLVWMWTCVCMHGYVNKCPFLWVSMSVCLHLCVIMGSVHQHTEHEPLYQAEDTLNACHRVRSSVYKGELIPLKNRIQPRTVFPFAKE